MFIPVMNLHVWGEERWGEREVLKKGPNAHRVATSVTSIAILVGGC